MTSPQEPNPTDPDLAMVKAEQTRAVAQSKTSLISRQGADLASLANGALSRSMVEPQNIAEMTALAQILAQACVVQMPDVGTRTRPAESGEILAMILNGRDLNLTAMQSIRGQYRIGSKWGLYVHMLHAKVRAHPLCKMLRRIEATQDRCVWLAQRSDEDEPTEYEYTWNDAVTAELSGNATYRKHPKRMLSIRALGEALVCSWPELAEGMGVAEELAEAHAADTSIPEDVVRQRLDEQRAWGAPRSGPLSGAGSSQGGPRMAEPVPTPPAPPKAEPRAPTESELYLEFLADCRSVGAKTKEQIVDACIALYDHADIQRLNADDRRGLVASIRTSNAADGDAILQEARAAPPRPVDTRGTSFDQGDIADEDIPF